MMNKRAEILKSEMLKIILAVIALSLLIILAVKLYGLFIVKTDLEQARATLTELNNKIGTLEDGEEELFLMTSPLGWYIVSYDSGEASPQACIGKDCLCICEDIKACDGRGVCKPFEEPINLISHCGENALGLTTNCMKINILNLRLFKEDKKIILGEELEIETYNIRSDFFEAISNGKTVDNLISDYLVGPSEELKKEIKDTITDYFVSNKVLEAYQWSLEINGDKSFKFGYVLKKGMYGSGGNKVYINQKFVKSIKGDKIYNENEYEFVFSYDLVV